MKEVKPDPIHDKKFAAMIKWLKENSMTAHTKINGHTEFRIKRS